MNNLRHFLIVWAIFALLFWFASSPMAQPSGRRWFDLNSTLTRSGAYTAIVRQEDCWDHQNYSIRIELPNKWFIDLDLENETDHNEDEPSIKWASPLTLEVVVRTESLKGAIERRINDYDSPNHAEITVVRRYIPR